MAKDHGPQIKDDKLYEDLLKQGNSKEKAARIANAGAARSPRKLLKAPLSPAPASARHSVLASPWRPVTPKPPAVPPAAARSSAAQKAAALRTVRSA